MKRFKDLSLKTKFILAFVLAGIVITVFAILVFFILSEKAIDKLENSNLEKESIGMINLICREQNMLLSNAKDYAHWNDMYDYVNNLKSKEWEAENITDWIPKNFNIDLILVMDNSGKLIYKYGNFD